MPPRRTIFYVGFSPGKPLIILGIKARGEPYLEREQEKIIIFSLVERVHSYGSRVVPYRRLPLSL